MASHIGTGPWELHEATKRAGPWYSILVRPNEQELIGFYIVCHILEGWELISHTKNRFVFRQGDSYRRFMRRVAVS